MRMSSGLSASRSTSSKRYFSPTRCATFSGSKNGAYADQNAGVWGVTANGTAFSGSDFTANAGTDALRLLVPPPGALRPEAGRVVLRAGLSC